MTRRPWIAVVSEEDATGPLRQSYDRHRDPETGVVDNILKIHSLRPETLESHVRLYVELMHSPGPLSRREREVVAVAVSVANACEY